MPTPEYWFSKAEFQDRLKKTQHRLRKQKLEALLAFQPETITYLTGFFTRAYDSFQFAIIPAHGVPVIICRDMEQYYLETTAVFGERFLWSDSEDKQALAAKAVAETVGLKATVGIELDSWQLNAKTVPGASGSITGAELC